MFEYIRKNKYLQGFWPKITQIIFISFMLEFFKFKLGMITTYTLSVTKQSQTLPHTK